MIKLRTIFSRVLIMLSISAIIFLLLFTFLFFYTLQQEKQVYNAARTQFYNEIESLLELNSEAMRIAVNDYTRSDDLVEFTKSKSITWFNEYIITAINSFKIDYLCVYDTSFNIICETSSLNILSRRFIPHEAVSAMQNQQNSNFFLVTTEGLIEVSAAPIHPAFDRYHTKTRPSGYTFFVRLWDHSFKTRLSRITSSKVDFQQLSYPKIQNDRSIVSVSKTLTDWNNKTVSHIIFSRGFNLNFKASKYLLLVLLISFFLGMLAYIIFARLWIYRPLNHITKILESENGDSIKKLQRAPGEFRYIGKLFNDYFEQRKTLEQAKIKAEESDNLKSVFLSNIAHEIRTPMHGIRGFAELLKKKALSAEQIEEYTSVIEKSSTRMLNTITDLIDLSRIESSQVEINYSLIAVDRLIESLYIIYRPETDKIGIQFTINQDAEPQKILIRTDKEKLQTIFDQLLRNAIKYTKKGFVELGYSQKGTFIEFYVKDTGIGIEKEKQPTIFESFTQADNSLSKKYEGVGLGLTIAKAYIELLGGTIWVNSEPGEGSVFYFTIPIESAK